MALVTGNWVTHRGFSAPLQHAFHDLESYVSRALRTYGVKFSEDFTPLEGYNPLSTERIMSQAVPTFFTEDAFTTVEEYDRRMAQIVHKVVFLVGAAASTLMDQVGALKDHVFISQKLTIALTEVVDTAARTKGYQGLVSLAVCNLAPPNLLGSSVVSVDGVGASPVTPVVNANPGAI